MKHTITLFVIAVLSGLVFVSPAAAKPLNTEFSVSVDFAEEELGPYPIGWDGETGVITDELDDYPVAAGEVVELDFNVLGTLEALGSSWVVVHRVLSADATIAPGGFSATAGAGAAPISYQQMVLVAEDDGSVIGLWVYTCSGHSNCTVSGSNSAEITNPTDLYVYSHDIFVSGTINTISITVDAETNPFFGGGTGEGTYKPVSLPDIFSIVNNLTVWANKTNPNVHAITSGEIGTIQHNMFGGSSWSVTVIPSWSDEPGDVMRYDNLQSINGKIGDDIIAGCVLGLAATSSAGGSYPVGKLTMTLPDNIQEDWPDYPDSPSNLPCDVAGFATQNCLDINPNFADDARYWNIDGPATSIPDGIEMRAGSSIYQDVALDSETAYIVTLVATVARSSTPTNIDVTFGEASTQLHLNPERAGGFVRLQSQALAPGNADFAPDLYRLKILNRSLPAPYIVPTVQIKFVCIGTTDPVSAPGACYFQDPDLTTDYFESDEEVTHEEGQAFIGGHYSSTGTYTIPATKAIWHDVDISAFVNAATTFHLRTKTSNGNGTPILPPYGRWHAYIRDSVTHDVIQEIGTWDTNAIIFTEKTIDFQLDASEHVVGELVILNSSDDIDETGWDLKIHSACLSVEGGEWPGYSNSDTGSLFVPDCALCTQPAPIGTVFTETLLSWIAEWLAYGWCYLGYILRCLVLTELNKIFDTVLSVIAGIGLFGVWVGMVVGALAAWAGDGLRFAFNNFQAWAIPVLNLIIAWLFTLPFVQSVVDLAGLAAIWFEGIFNFIMAVLGLFLLALQFLAALLNLIPIAWNAFLSGMSAPSTITFPIPDCTNPATTFYDACLPFDVMNFLFDQVFMLPILLSVAVFAKAWRVIRRTWRSASEEFAT